MNHDARKSESMYKVRKCTSGASWASQRVPADKLALTKAARGGPLGSAPPFPATVAQTAQHHSQHSCPQAGVVIARCFILKAYSNHNFVIVKRTRIYGPEFSALLESLWLNSKGKPHSYTRP